MVILPRTFLTSICFSEARDKARIDQIAQFLAQQSGIQLLEVAPNKGGNRTHLFCSCAEQYFVTAITEFAAFLPGILRLEKIEDNVHSLLQSITLFPFQQKDLAKISAIAQKTAKLIAKACNAPVYLYGTAAVTKQSSLNRYRQQQRETLANMMSEDNWKPDFGPLTPHSQLGCLFIGSRLLPVNLELHFAGDEITFWENLLLSREVPENDLQTSLFNEENEPDENIFAEYQPLLTRLQTFVDDSPNEKRIRIWCNIPDYFSTPLRTIIDAFKAIGNHSGMPYSGGRIVGFIPAEVLENKAPLKQIKGLNKADDNAQKYMMKVIEDMQLNAIENFVIQRQVVDLLIDHEIL